jgi:hypothetical protein
VYIAGYELGSIQQLQMKIYGGGNTGNGTFGKGATQAPQGVIPVHSPNNQLANQ